MTHQPTNFASCNARLKRQIQRHAYVKGQYKGDAPLESSRRGRSHARVLANATQIRYHNTDIVTLRSDRIVINGAGWAMAPTTRKAFNNAFRLLWLPFSVYTHRVCGLSHVVLSTPKGMVVLYDWMEVDYDGNLLTKPVPFQAKRVDKARMADVRVRLTESGFFDLLPMLHATCQPPGHGYRFYIHAPQSRLLPTLSNSDQSENWPAIVAEFKYDRTYNYLEGREEITESDLKTTRARMMRALTKDAKINVSLDVTLITK